MAIRSLKYLEYIRVYKQASLCWFVVFKAFVIIFFSWNKLFYFCTIVCLVLGLETRNIQCSLKFRKFLIFICLKYSNICNDFFSSWNKTLGIFKLLVFMFWMWDSELEVMKLKLKPLQFLFQVLEPKPKSELKSKTKIETKSQFLTKTKTKLKSLA